MKAYYSLKKTVDNKTPESEIYEKLTKLRHDTQGSIIKLLHDIADIQKHGAEKDIAKYRKSWLVINLTI